MSFKNLAQISLIIFAGLLILRQVLALNQLIQSFPLNDFGVYLQGVQHTLTGNPYAQKFFDYYNYPPAATLFFYPLTLLPINTSEFIFTGLSIISLFITIWLLCKLTTRKLTFHFSLLTFYLFLRFSPTRLTLTLGQINLIVLLLIILSFYWYTKKRQIPAGVSLALAFIFKFTPAILLLFFLLRKQFKLISAFLITVLMINLLAVLVFGWPITQFYYFKVLPSLLNQTGFYTMQRTYMNQSFTALLGRLGFFDTYHTLIKLAFTLPLLWFLSRRRHDFTTYALFLSFMTIFLPTFSWQHHYVFLIPSLFLLGIRSLALGIVSYLLLNFTISAAFPGYPNPLVHSHLFLSATIIFFLMLVLPPPNSPNRGSTPAKLAG